MARRFERRAGRPENRKLRDAIAKLAHEPTHENRAALHRRLLAGPVLIAVRILPGEIGGPEAIAGDVPVNFVTHAGPEGRPVLAAFSDPDAVAARAPAAVWLQLEPAALLTWVFEAGLEGVLLNPQGPSAFVSHDEARQLLGLRGGAAAGRAPSQSDETESALREALARLLEGDADAAGLVVSEPRTGRSLHFARFDADGLLMTVPLASLSRDEVARATLMFDELAGFDADDDPKPEQEGEPSELQALFSGDVARAAHTALKVFTWAFGFPPGFQLELDEGGS